jgi:hypothetical protein
MIDVDYLLELSEAVQTARTIQDFKRESLLFRYLIRIFRSPEDLLKLTRRKTEKEKRD